MLTTVQTLLATAIGVVPGAVYVAAYDGQLGQGRSSLPDRLTRYVTTSAVLHALLAPGTLLLAQQLSDIPSGSYLETNPWWALVPGVLYVAVPALAGAVHGTTIRVRGRSPISALFRLFPQSIRPETATAAPSSWDHLLVGRGPGYVRLRLRDGAWVGGFWGHHENRDVEAHASLSPEPRDLFLPQVAVLDRDGEYQVDDAGAVQLRDEGLSVRWADIDIVRFSYAESTGPTEVTGPEGSDG